MAGIDYAKLEALLAKVAAFSLPLNKRIDAVAELRHTPTAEYAQCVKRGNVSPGLIGYNDGCVEWKSVPIYKFEDATSDPNAFIIDYACHFNRWQFDTAKAKILKSPTSNDALKHRINLATYEFRTYNDFVGTSCSWSDLSFSGWLQIFIDNNF